MEQLFVLPSGKHLYQESFIRTSPGPSKNHIEAGERKV